MAKAKHPFTEFVDSTINTQYTAADTQTISESNLDALLTPGEAKKLKAVIRTSCLSPSNPLRYCLWYKLGLRHRKMRPFSYNELEKEYTTNGRELSIPSFVDQSMIQRYHMTQDGSMVVTKLLFILGKSHPDITYAPHLYSIACLLLHYMTEDKVYTCLEVLMTSQNMCIHQTHISYEASALVLRALLKKHAKKTYDWLRQQTLELADDVFADWLLWIFRDLPFPHLVCIVDCYLNEGIKVLYRVAIAVLIHFHKQQVNKPSDSSNISISISEFCRHDMAGVAIQMSLKTAFSIRSVSRKEIKKLMSKKEMYIQSVHTTKSLQSNLVYAASLETRVSLEVTLQRSFSLQDVKSNLLSADQWDTIWNWIPDRVTLLVPTLLFSTSEHGTSLKTFYNNVQDREGNPSTLLVIQTTSGQIFGAYCSTDWEDRLHQDRNMQYFGTGETFVFTLEPAVHKYPWVGIALQKDIPMSANYFMAGDNKQIYIGGGGGMAISLDGDLCAGRTETCDSFNNPPLSTDSHFTVATLEVFGFVS